MIHTLRFHARRAYWRMVWVLCGFGMRTWVRADARAHRGH